MSQPKKRTQKPIELAKSILGYVSESYRDYIAARVLFNNHQLIQACCLANTAIEKFFKALIEIEGEKIKWTHDLNKLLPLIEKYEIELYNKLNKDFLKSIAKVYSSRYIGSSNTGYNIIILRNKFTAELDYTYSLLEPKIRIAEPSVIDNMITPYEADLMRKNQALLQNNYILLNASKTKLIEQTTEFVLELRMHNHSVIEATYTTNQSKDDGLFDFESLKPSGNEDKSFQLCFLGPEKSDLHIIQNNRILIGEDNIR